MIEYLRLEPGPAPRSASGPAPHAAPGPSSGPASTPASGQALPAGLVPLGEFQPGCLIDLSSDQKPPVQSELELVAAQLGCPLDYLTDSLDPSERPYLVTEGQASLMVFRIPYRNQTEQDSALPAPFRTVALGVVLTPRGSAVVCSRAGLARSFLNMKKRGHAPSSGLALALGMFFQASAVYIKYLQELYQMTEDVEQGIKRNMRNEDLARMMLIEKALVYFATSLKGNAALLDKLQNSELLRQEWAQVAPLLEDAVIECRQAAEMAAIYIQILSSINETSAALISNNMNMAMRFLAAITLILTVPTVIVGFYGMNVDLPFQGFPLAWAGIGAGTVLVCWLLWRGLSRKHWM